MTPFQRSRRLQAGLAGLGVLSTLGAAVGFDLATTTHSSVQTGTTGTSTSSGTSGSNGTRSARSGESDDGSRAASQRQAAAEPGHAPQQHHAAGDHERVVTR